MNARRHGIMSLSPVVGTEREADWAAHLEGIEASLVPANALEASLVGRIALLLWRLRRVAAYETESMAVALAGNEEAWRRDETIREDMAQIPFYGSDARQGPPDKGMWMRRREAGQMLPAGETLERVLRYETHLHRQLLQTMHELEALQARRLGETTPLARLDVAGGPWG